MRPKLGISQRRSSALRRGFTLIELLVAASVGIMVIGTPIMLLIESAREERRGLADATAEQAAAKLQNQILGYVRAMSAQEGVVFSVPATDSGGETNGFRSIILARGPAPDYPREQISFDAGAGRVLYYPNRLLPDTAIVMMQNQSNVVVRQVNFSPSLKMDGTVDNALINVLIQLDDNGCSGRSVMPNPASIWRTFSVRMRNN
jgi:prepilin-type N-terminal cleavage/methylation domain-containing protein